LRGSAKRAVSDRGSRVAGSGAGWVAAALAVLAVLAQAACSGGGGGGPTGPPPPTSSITFTPGSGGGANSVSLAAESSTDSTTLLLDVRANTVTDLYGVALNLSYPSAALHFAGATEGTFENAAGGVATSFQAVEGPTGTLVLAVSRLGAVPGATGSGVLMTLRFTSTASGSGTFNLSRNAGFDSTGLPISGLSWAAGSVQVTVVH
jgi:hypothetical protein